MGSFGDFYLTGGDGEVDAEADDRFRVLDSAATQAITNLRVYLDHGVDNPLINVPPDTRPVSATPGRRPQSTLFTRCKSLPQIFYLDDVVFFESRLRKVAQGNWVSLHKCRWCRQHWRLDDWDKYTTQFAVKIDDPQHWETFDSTDLEKGLLLESRGGTTDKKCIWAGCGNKSVQGVAYCIDHLYESGARR